MLRTTRNSDLFGFTGFNAPLDESDLFRQEIITLRNQLNAANKAVNEKIETIARQEEEIARLNKKYRSAMNSRIGSSTSIPKDVWRRLLQLCHPDKHSNSEAATAATQWLNANKPV